MNHADSGLTRRAALAGLSSLAAPLVIGMRAAAAGPEPLAAILERSGLGAATGFALADARDGAMIEAHQPDLDRPPASTAKIVTALWALDRLGPAHRFETRVAALAGGGAALVGGGDPLLDTDALGDLAAEAGAAGLGATDGPFLVAFDALPTLRDIEPDQPATAGYNPAISGLNLNFNRVHVAWEPGEGGPRLRANAPGQRFDVDAPSVVAELGPAGPPRHRMREGREVWAFGPASVRGSGGVWLPVRAPALYAGTVFRALIVRDGRALPAPAPASGAVPAATLAVRSSQPLAPMMKDMLKYSTNLTAEVAGLSAARAGGATATNLAASAGAMSDWARARYGLRRLRLVNHSGLTARSAMSAFEMVRLLVEAQADGLPDLLRERAVSDGDGGTVRAPGVRVIAKTGTLNFVSALAGFVEGPGDRRRAFAIFAADGAARNAIPPDAREDPPGAARWARRARAQEHALLRRWIAHG